MTLADLINRATDAGRCFSSHYIPLKYEGQDVEITLTPEGSNETGWVINLQIETIHLSTLYDNTGSSL